MTRRTQRERVSLPWEGRGGRWRNPLHGTRWQALLGALLLIALTLGFARYARRRVQLRDTRVVIAQVKQAIDQFRSDVGRCPVSETELLHPPLSQKRYLAAMPKDGWGRSLAIRCPGYFAEEAEVISAGPSGSFLKDDNIQ